ncbi:transposase [Paraburkholderia sp. BL23I1N1]|nr:transposase [Paraburkholderia sp. BL23I1N1]
MRCVVELSEAEELTLQQLSINHRYRDTRTRAAGLLKLGRGIRPQAIAEQFGVSARSVYNWFHAWRGSGICGLMGGHCGGRRPLLSEAQIAVALEIARTEPLTLVRIAQRVEAVLNEPLPCKIETLGEALKRSGFSFKRNRFSLKKSATKKRSP